MRSSKLIAIILLFLFAGLSFAQSEAQLKVDVVDKTGHVVSDALIIANYQEVIDSKIIDNRINGTTNTGGAFDTTIFFEEGSIPASHMFIQAYHPYWSSSQLRTRIPNTDEKIITQRFEIPIEFETYRIRVSGPDGLVLSSINIHMLYPFFVSKKTEANGIAQFRVPKGLIPYGRIKYEGEYEDFNFIKNGEKTNFINTDYPFKNPLPIEDEQKYSMHLQVFDSSNEILGSHPFIVSIEDANDTYLTDSQGNLRINDIPKDKVTLYWRLYNYTYSKEFNLKDALPQKLISDRLLRIHTPSILHLGESCYRVEVNITDPREGALKQVVAKALDGDKTIAITLEQNQTINQTHITFNRIFCVVDDTTFDIVATSPYENATLTIKLLKTPETAVAPPVEIQTSRVGDLGVPDFIIQRAEEQKKIEMIVILMELLIFLVIIYGALKFRENLIYYLRAVIRFVYLYMEPFLKKKSSDE